MKSSLYLIINDFIVTRMGCFKGYNGHGVHPFPKYVNLRSQLDWYKVEEIVRKCKDLVKAKGYSVRYMISRNLLF